MLAPYPRHDELCRHTPAAMTDKELDNSVRSGKFMDNSAHSGTALFTGKPGSGSDLEKETSREFQVGWGGRVAAAGWTLSPCAAVDAAFQRWPASCT